MIKNPYLNAVLASGYIVGIVLLISQWVDSEAEGSLLLPMTMLSLFVLSAAVMGFLFVYQPLSMFLENRKQEALVFFAKTVGTFACLTGLLIVILLNFISNL